MWVELLIIVLLILANGVFAGAELAVISIRKTRLQELVDQGSSRARDVQVLRTQPERFLATVQIGITVVGATASAFGGASLAQHLVEPLRRMGLERSAEGAAFALVVAFVSYLSLVLGELVPKSLALKYSEGYGLVVAKPLRGLSWLGQPLIWLLTQSSNVVLKAFGDRTTFTESRLSPEELQQLVEEAARVGTLNPKAGEIASRAFDLNDLRVSEVMVPRQAIVALPSSANADEVKQLLLEHGHSRMPVYEGTVDNVVGYVTAKDLLSLVWERALIVLNDVVRPAYFVPETKRAVEALQELQAQRIQLAIVIDETGGVSGLVTVEDLVEEVVGDIFGEHDRVPETIRREGNGAFLIQATTPIREVNRALATELPEGEGFTTLAGLVLRELGRIPGVGTRVALPDGSHLEVVDASPRRVRTVRLYKADVRRKT